MRRPVSLTAIRTFCLAARYQSLKDAASALCITPGAVSRQIQALEASLGTALFLRKFRQIALTTAGRDYLAQIGPALDVIDRATRCLQEPLVDEQTRPLVRVEATPTFAMYWLIPRLAGFQRACPDIDISLSTSQGVIDIRKPVDVFIRRDPQQFEGLVAAPFMTEFAALVCSPELAGWRRLRRAADIVRAPRIGIRSRADLWPQWCALNELEASAVAPGRLFDNTILAIQAAIEGLGVALIPRLFLDAHLAGGALVELPGTRTFPTGAYHLLRNDRPAGSAAGIFSDWLRLAAQTAENGIRNQAGSR